MFGCRWPRGKGGLGRGRAGLADARAKRAIRADTVFRIGEVSKQFTATAVLLLAQDGELALDDRLSRHHQTASPIGVSSCRAARARCG